MSQHNGLVAAVMAGAALFCVSTASAVYTNLSVEKHATVNAGGVLRDVWRVYANFTDPGDRSLSGYGSNTWGTMVIQSRNFNDTAAGSAFYNAPGGANIAPAAADIAGNPDLAWDSFVTVGVSVADQAPFGDYTSLSPGFPNLAGTSLTTSNGGWYTIPTIDHDNDEGTAEIPNPQTLAGFAGDGDAGLRVLMMQLTVNAGDNVRGTVNLSIWNAGNSTGSLAPQQTFNSIPAPGALALLTFVGLIGKRRR